MMILVAATALVPQSVPNSAEFARWGRETLSLVRKDYSVPGSKLLTEDIGSKQPAFNWGVGVMLSALAAAAHHDPSFKPWLREYADATRVYWNDEGPVPGYDVLPSPKPVDRYYDDNAWMVMALVETYEVLGDTKYLDWAEGALKFALSGEDSQLGGGVFWKEVGKTEKNTCSNGPTAAACLALNKHRRSSTLVETAERLYGWTKSKLQDPTDGLYFDNVNLSGTVEKTKWTYNTALMLRTAKDLYGLTKKRTYLADSRRMEASSISRWFDLEKGGVRDESKFAHLLTENLEKHQEESVSKALAFVWEKIRDSKGHFGSRWDREVGRELPKPTLIDQASAARAFFVQASRTKR